MLPLKINFHMSRMRATQALGLIGDPRAVEPLIALIAAIKDEEDEWGIRVGAAKALRKITKQYFGQYRKNGGKWAGRKTREFRK